MATRFPIETDQPVIEVTLPVGRHVLELVVEDSAGLRSAPDTVVITVQRADAVAVAVAPVTAALLAGAQQQFAAAVTGTSNTAVIWSVQESGGGSVSTTGLYTAPATAGTFHVRATSVADPTKSASATVTVTAVSIAISPTSASVIAGATRQFTATVTGTSNTAVTWSVQESGGGTVSTTGLYTAPATAGTFHVRATSVADPTKSASATVTVTPVSCVAGSPGVPCTGAAPISCVAGSPGVPCTGSSPLVCVAGAPGTPCTGSAPMIICTGATPTVVCSGATPSIVECVAGAPTATCTGSAPTVEICTAARPAVDVCTAARPTVAECVVGGPTNNVCTGATPRILECTGGAPTIIRSEPERAPAEKPTVKPKGKPKK
jgi:hypothetical protein